MTADEQDDIAALIRSGLILTGLATVPVSLLMGLFGPVFGLLALSAAIPISAHLGGLVSLGDSPERAWARARAEARLVGQVTGLSTLFWLLIVSLIPEEISRVPILPIMISSLYAMALYAIGMRGGRDTVMSRIGVPVLLVLVMSTFII